MKLSKSGIDFLLSEEGFSPNAYADGGFYSIGYGHQIQPSENYLLNATITREQAQKIFQRDLIPREQAINNLVKVPINQNQFDALISLIYNIGIGNFSGSSLLQSINSGASEDEIRANWRKWNKSQGNVLEVLVNRRERELLMYFKKIYISKTTLNYYGLAAILLIAGIITLIIYLLFENELFNTNTD